MNDDFRFSMTANDTGFDPAVQLALENKMPAPTLDLEMTTDRAGVTETGKEVPVGTSVIYVAHVPGGMVKVRLADGSVEVLHPHCFPTLR